jgi:hypothetical protein
MKHRSLSLFPALIFLFPALIFFVTLIVGGTCLAETPLSAESRSATQQERICSFLATQINRPIHSFYEEFGPVTTQTESTIKLPSQIGKFGRLVRIKLAQHLSLDYLVINNQSDQVVEIATDTMKTLQKLGLNIDSLYDLIALFGKPDISEGDMVRYECDMNFAELSANPNSLSIIIGTHID